VSWLCVCVGSERRQQKQQQCNAKAAAVVFALSVLTRKSAKIDDAKMRHKKNPKNHLDWISIRKPANVQQQHQQHQQHQSQATRTRRNFNQIAIIKNPPACFYSSKTKNTSSTHVRTRAKQ
jgi:hypothetical protein